MEELEAERAREAVYRRAIVIVSRHGLARLFCEGLEKYCTHAEIEEKEVKDVLRRVAGRSVYEWQNLFEQLLATAVKTYLHPFHSLSRRFCQHHVEHGFSNEWKVWFEQVARRNEEYFDEIYLRQYDE